MARFVRRWSSKVNISEHRSRDVTTYVLLLLFSSHRCVVLHPRLIYLNWCCVFSGGRRRRPVQGLRLPAGHEDLEPDDGEGEADGERAGGQDGGDGTAQGKPSRPQILVVFEGDASIGGGGLLFSFDFIPSFFVSRPTIPLNAVACHAPCFFSETCGGSVLCLFPT